MGKSTTRVSAALQAAGISPDVKTVPASTRTAEDAAAACSCELGQIVKSLIFAGGQSNNLFLLLVSGANQVDTKTVSKLIGEPLERADPKDVRARTGFAIGGVSPIGHLERPSAYMDERLFEFDTVWAAAGAPNTVFSIQPQRLETMTAAIRFTA
ncbi:MAG: YbaK/EbsC family protein [Pseudomonadota bacterium]